MLALFRGLPGSGKTHMARRYFNGIFHLEADIFCMRDGRYVFLSDEHAMKHALCLEFAETALKVTGCDIVVSNTFTRKWEIEPYLELARKLDVPYQIFAVKSKALVLRGVPKDVLGTMRSRWEKMDGEVILTNPVEHIGQGIDVVGTERKRKLSIMDKKVVKWADSVGYDIRERCPMIDGSTPDWDTANVRSLK